MGKGMNAKRIRDSRKPITRSDLEAAQRGVNGEIARAKADAAEFGTSASQAVIYLALHRAFGFGLTRMQRLLDAQEVICQRVMEDKGYDIENVYDDLAEVGIELKKPMRLFKRDGYYSWHNLKKRSRDLPAVSDRYTVYYTYKDEGRLVGAYGVSWWHDGKWHADADHEMEIADGYKIIGWRIDDRFEGEV